VLKTGDLRVGEEAEDTFGTVLYEHVLYFRDALVGSVEQTDLDSGVGCLRKLYDFAGTESSDIAIDRYHRPLGPEKDGCGGPRGDPGLLRRALAEKIVEHLSSAMGDEPLRYDHSVAETFDQLFAQHQGSIPGM
jgi:hypothetical protein